MEYVTNSRGTMFIEGRYKITKAARMFDKSEFVILKRISMQSNDYEVIPGECYRNADDAIKRVQAMIKAEDDRSIDNRIKLVQGAK